MGALPSKDDTGGRDIKSGSRPHIDHLLRLQTSGHHNIPGASDRQMIRTADKTIACDAEFTNLAGQLNSAG
jgi:hypothetical protein